MLAEVGQTWQPKGATAIVMDPRDGVDPRARQLAAGRTPTTPGDAPDYASQNRAVGATYEPGSTFKAFTVAGALRTARSRPTRSSTSRRRSSVADREIRESHARGHGHAARRARSSSSPRNIGAVTIGLRLGAKRFDYWVRTFGFGKPTGVDLPGEESGIVLPLAKYSGSSMGNLPIGQGIAVTPMQMARRLLGDRQRRRPAPAAHRRVDRRRADASRPQGHRVLSEATAGVAAQDARGRARPGRHRVRRGDQGLRAGRQDRHGAEAGPVTGGYSDSEYVASFVGFAPAKHPKLLVAVMVDEPQGDIYGGPVAAPAWKKITSFALNYLKIRARMSLQSVARCGLDATHDVVNQSAPFEDVDLFEADVALREALGARGRRLGRGPRARRRRRRRLGRGAGARAPRGAQRAAAADPRPLRPPDRRGRARPVAGTGCCAARSSARSTRCRGATRARAPTWRGPRSSCCGRRPTRA